MRYLLALVCLAACSPDSGIQTQAPPDVPDQAPPDIPGDPLCTSGRVLWSQDLGTAANDGMDLRSAFVRMGDGDYALAGWSGQLTGDRHSMLVKLGPTGVARWTQVYGTGGGWDVVRTLVPITNGLIACGAAGPSLSGFMCPARRHCAICFRTGLDGTASWKRAYPGAANDVFLGNSALATATGILLAGYTTDGDPWIDAMTLPVGLDGAPGAITTYRNDGEDAFNDLAPIGDGTYLAAGNAHGWRPCQQPFVAHLASNGARLGQYDLGPCAIEAPGSAKGEERGAALAIEPLNGGHAVVVGRQWAGATERAQAFVAEVSGIDTTPATAWRKLYGGTGDDWFNAVVKLPDGFLLVGTTSTATQGRDAYVVRTNLMGDELWQKSYGGPGDQEGVGALLAADGNLLVAGNNSAGTVGGSDLFVMAIKNCP